MKTSSSQAKRERVVEVADEIASVEISSVVTPCGVRMEITSPDSGESLRLDPLALESLSWQQNSDLSEILDDDIELKETADLNPDDEIEEETITFSNEYTRVEVTIFSSSEEDYILIESKQLGYQKIVSPSVLDALTSKKNTIFSDFLSTPFGPVES